MYAELIQRLTVNERKALGERGVTNTRISEWRTGLRLPTRPQVLALAEVANVDPMDLERELMVIEAEKEAERKPQTRELLARFTGSQKINDVISE